MQSLWQGGGISRLSSLRAAPALCVETLNGGDIQHLRAADEPR